MEPTSRGKFLDAPGQGVAPGLELFGLYRPRGECSLSEVAELVRNAVEYCAHGVVTRLIVNLAGLTGFSIPTLVDRFLWAEELAQAAQSKVAVALVVPEEYIDPEKFGVAVAARFGFKLEVFSSENEALTWVSSLTKTR